MVLQIIQVFLSVLILILLIMFRFWINPKIKIMERMGQMYKIFFEVAEQGIKILKKERESLRSQIIELENSRNGTGDNVELYKSKYNAMMDQYLNLEDRFFDLLKRFNAISPEDYYSQQTRENIHRTLEHLANMGVDVAQLFGLNKNNDE